MLKVSIGFIAGLVVCGLLVTLAQPATTAAAIQSCALHSLRTHALPHMSDGAYKVYQVSSLYDTQTAVPIYVLEALGNNGERDVRLYRIARHDLAGLAEHNILQKTNADPFSIEVKDGKAWVSK